MLLNELLAQRDMTMYRLSKESRVPYTTINDICAGKAKIEKCSAETLYRISRTLAVTMESLIAYALEYRGDFETFKSNICHQVRNMGDVNFIIHILENDEIRKYYNRKWFPEALYLLAMVDYLSKENNLPHCANYDDIRKTKLQRPLFPVSILTLSAALNSEQPKKDSLKDAIPEFMRFNIVESEIRDVV
jgi:plasmid maintenance system antidote protein VapI